MVEVKRSFNPEAIHEAIDGYADVDMWDWVLNDRNVALTDGSENDGLFEQNSDGVFYGHYFFTSARGKSALFLARAILSEMFDKYEAKIIIGLTPEENRKARWISRKLGMKDTGTEDGYVVYTLTKEDLEDE